MRTRFPVTREELSFGVLHSHDYMHNMNQNARCQMLDPLPNAMRSLKQLQKQGTPLPPQDVLERQMLERSASNGSRWEGIAP